MNLLLCHIHIIKNRILFLWCVFWFSAQVAIAQEKIGSSACGVLINGVYWAKSNVDEPGTFATTPESCGMLYQWNRKKGWSATGEVSGWDNSNPSGESWDVANDPCPIGWRVPNLEEIKVLLDEAKVNSTWTSQNGIYGRKITDNMTGNTIFLPCVPCRVCGELVREEFGNYWSSSQFLGTHDYAQALRFSNTQIWIQYLFRNQAYSVRCVVDKEVPTCSDVVVDTSETICAKNLPYQWRDTVFDIGTKSGTYRFQRINTVTGCDSIVNLHLTVERPCPGVLINGVCWAEYNVDEPGTFANPGKPYGMLYQWNRKKGWPAITPDSVTGWDSSLEPGDTWEPANDPCPAGWRMPTVKEIETLLDETKVTRTDKVGQDKALGMRYTDIATGNMVFFPTAGCRQEVGNTAFAFVHKTYWSSTDYWTLYWNYESPKRWPLADALSVRCVADENACDIVLTASDNICKEALPYPWRDTTFQAGTTTGEYRIRRTDPANGCDSIFYLYLTVDTLCGKPCKERGVLVNGVCWAESNVDSPNTFAETPESFGLMYQWNRKKGLPPKGWIDWEDWSFNIKDTRWEATNNPCPTEWRIPTVGEIHSLLDDLNVTREWTQQNEINGMRFTDKTNGNSIFMPAAEYRLGISDLPPSYIDGGGHYWTSISYAFEFFKTSIFAWHGDINNAYSVRCVAGRDTTGCNSTTDTSVIICANDLPYEWRDTVFGVGTKSGIYRFQRISTVTGCDSIVNLNLTVHQPFDMTVYDTICSNALPYPWRDTTFDVGTESGIYCFQRISTVTGCDSIVNLHLTVHQSFDKTVYDCICSNALPYPWRDTTFGVGTKSGVYRFQRISTVTGCDSIVNLHLTVHQPLDTIV